MVTAVCDKTQNMKWVQNLFRIPNYFGIKFYFFWFQSETYFDTKLVLRLNSIPSKKLEESRKREFAKPKHHSLDDWSGWWHLMTVIMVSGWWWLMTMTGISGWWQVMRMTDIRLMMGNDGDWWVWFHSLGRFQQSQSQSARKEMHLTR